MHNFFVYPSGSTEIFLGKFVASEALQCVSMHDMLTFLGGLGLVLVAY